MSPNHLPDLKNESENEREKHVVENYLSSVGAGFSELLSWKGIFIPILGTLLSMVTSFLPGVGGTSFMALVVVLTINWDPISIMLLFGALTGGATFMGSITAILFNIPGSASSAAALLDGYPLGRKGFPQTAIACAATASAIGSIFGVVVLILVLPFIRSILLEFGPFELFLLAIWGLTTLVAIPNSSSLKAFVMCALGLLLALIGSDPTSGQPRWNFGSMELFQGISIIPVLLGIFTLAELITWVKRYDLGEAPVFKRSQEDSSIRGILAVFKHIGLTFRSAITGTLVGIIPGVGGTVASFVAYGQAAQTVGGGENDFGNGDIRGLIAPESAVDAKDGGSLLPVIAFGIPGSEGGVILVSVLAIHGIVPGMPMLTSQLDLTFVLIFALLFSNILTSVVGVGMSPYLARLTELRIDRIVLPALIISLVAIVQLDAQLSDMYLAIGFGVFGYFLKRHDWPRIPFIIAFVLGDILEANLALSVQLIDLGRVVPYERPASIGIFLLLLVSLWWMGRKSTRAVKKGVTQEDKPIALFLLALLVVFFGIAILSPSGYSNFATGVSGLALALIVLILFMQRLSAFDGLAVTIPADHRLPILAMLSLPILVTVFGLPIAIGLMVLGWNVALNDWHWGRTSWRHGAWAAAAAGLVHAFIQSSTLILPDPLLLAWIS